MKPRLKLLSLALLVAFVPIVALWVKSREMTHLWWVVPGAVALTVPLGLVWYLIFGRARGFVRLLRAAAAVLFLGGAGFAASRLIRYEGSSSGSSFPKFAWVWESHDTTESAPANPLPRGDATPSTPMPIPPGAADLIDFLGPGRDGMWAAPTFASDWSADPPRLLWRRPIGRGWSSFVVSGSRTLTQQQLGDDELVTCLDLGSGRELWNYADRGVRLLLERAENGGAAMGGDGPRATPAIHRDRVFTMGATGIAHALDLATGEEVWTRHLLRELGAIAQRWGMANSPLILTEHDLVVFAGPDQSGPTLVACEMESGATRWIQRGSGASYNSPRLVEIGGVTQIVNVEFAAVSGVDPATGAVLWSHPWPGSFPKVGQPIVLPGDRLLVTASYGAGSLLLAIARDESGRFSVEERWKSSALKTKFSSPVVLEDHAYGLDEGRLACIDLDSGKRVWKKEKFGFGQQLLFGRHLLVQTEAGDVVVGTISPEGFVETGRLAALSSMTWNAPAVAGRILLVRNDREAAAWLLPPPTNSTHPPS